MGQQAGNQNREKDEERRELALLLRHRLQRLIVRQIGGVLKIGAIGIPLWFAHFLIGDLTGSIDLGFNLIISVTIGITIPAGLGLAVGLVAGKWKWRSRKQEILRQREVIRTQEVRIRELESKLFRWVGEHENRIKELESKSDSESSSSDENGDSP